MTHLSSFYFKEHPTLLIPNNLKLLSNYCIVKQHMDPVLKAINQVKVLCEQVPIRDNIICLLHYGSVKNKEDFNDDSDLDFHLVLKEIDKDTLIEIKNIFGFSSKKIDLSFHSLDEIIYKDNIIFQNGN